MFWDVFISHASEDKDSFVRPLAKALHHLGLSVWYDEFSLRPGDSLCRSIDKGLADSKFGIVVISSNFIKKEGSEYELRGLVSRETSQDRIILPIWLDITHDEVVKFSPSLADKIALKTSELNAHDIAINLLRKISPDKYSQYSQEELHRYTNGTAVQNLQEQLNFLQEKLSEYQCPYCGSQIISRIEAPADDDFKHWDLRETFECGFTRFGSIEEQHCSKHI